MSTIQTAVARNVEIAEGNNVNIRFKEILTAEGETIFTAKTRSLPPIVIRRLNSKEVVGHLRGKRSEILATGSSEKSVFAKAVQAAWVN